MAWYCTAQAQDELPDSTLERVDGDGEWRKLARTRPLELRVKAALADLSEAGADATDAALQPPQAERSVLSGSNHASFARKFDDAKVPYCLHGDGLKRQSTYFLNGYIALPFIFVARARGKCLF